MRRRERVTLLVIPEAGGRTYEYKILRVVILGGLVAALAVVGLLLAGLFFYVQGRASEAQVARLQREKALLEEEVGRIDELEKVLLELQLSNKQLRAVLGESVREQEEPRRGDARSSQSLVPPEKRLRWGYLRTFPGMWPAQGIVRSPFVARRGGLIIALPSGSLVWAAGAGQVSRAGYDEVLGNVICVDHGGGLTTTYGYVHRLLVEAGDYVEKGQPLALSGRSGRAVEPGLFYAVQMNRQPLDPLTLRLWL